ncbi:unnamed protein product, partial [Sphacelaria rigidula]
DFLFFGGVSRAWRSAWGDRPAETGGVMAHTSVTQVLYSLECGLHLEAKLCAASAGLGRLDVLKCLRARKCPWDGNTCWRAAGGGHLEILQWARQNGCPWDENT